MNEANITAAKAACAHEGDARHVAGEADIAAAAEALCAGKAVVFPTDTVYGVGVAVGAASSPRDIYRFKRRDADKAIPWLVGSAFCLDEYGANVPASARKLAQRFWPGPLTIIVNAADAVPAAFRADNGTVALRMPDDSTALELLRRVGVPLATSSANFQGECPPQTLAQVDNEFAAQVSCVLGDDEPRSGISSTIVECTGERPRIVREGAITAREIESALKA